MGSATAYHLSKRHTKVLGLEAFVPAHNKGSSHGESRIIRQAYFEDPAYVPLVLRAYELWDELQNESNEHILSITGGVAIGSPRQGLITGCLKSARKYGLEHDLLDAREMRRRFPQFALADNEVAFHEEKAGFLRPEECIRQHLRCASKHGADLHFRRHCFSWSASQSGEGVSVTTKKQTYHARSLMISVGPWFAGLVPNVSVPSPSHESHVLAKLASQPSAFDRRIFPIFIWELSKAPCFGCPRTREMGSKSRHSYRG
jgi:sarcosine oxidase